MTPTIVTHKIGEPFDPIQIHEIRPDGAYEFRQFYDRGRVGHTLYYSDTRKDGPMSIGTRGGEQYVFYYFHPDGTIMRRHTEHIQRNVRIDAEGNILICEEKAL